MLLCPTSYPTPGLQWSTVCQLPGNACMLEWLFVWLVVLVCVVYFNLEGEYL